MKLLKILSIIIILPLYIIAIVSLSLSQMDKPRKRSV